ncbi:hypothetical protein MMC13_004732 [Lambiella insularis]|nr:hypothetical protein [Lambiella insularis]
MVCTISKNGNSNCVWLNGPVSFVGSGSTASTVSAYSPGSQTRNFWQGFCETLVTADSACQKVGENDFGTGVLPPSPSLAALAHGGSFTLIAEQPASPGLEAAAGGGSLSDNVEHDAVAVHGQSSVGDLINYMWGAL